MLQNNPDTPAFAVQTSENLHPCHGSGFHVHTVQHLLRCTRSDQQDWNLTLTKLDLGCCCRREQQAAAANAALQAQLTQQQHMLDAQQQQLSGMQEQLMQLKDMHKKKLTCYKAQLQQQYESQLAAATTAYTQELSMVHVSSPSAQLAT